MRGLQIFSEQYKEIWRTVHHEWEDTESRWHDQRRDQFDREFWMEFSRETQNIDREIEKLGGVMNEVARLTEC